MAREVAIVGAGKVGTALARLLSQAGYTLGGVASRSPASAREACAFAGAGRPAAQAAEAARGADLVFITTPDDALRGVAEELAGSGAVRSGATVAHCSGALSSDVLAPLRGCGAHVGSMHPLQSFATAEEAVRLLPHSACALEGDPEAMPVLERVVRDLGCRSFRLSPAGKPLYHAAAVMASNYLVALQDVALRLMEAADVPRAEALPALLPLIRGTVGNLERVGIPQCLTGPIARGDAATVELHLAAIKRRVPELLSLYKQLGRAAVEVALDKGTITSAAGEELEGLLE